MLLKTNAQSALTVTLALLASCGLLQSCGPRERERAEITVNSSTEYQTIRGWEATLDLDGHVSPGFANVRDELLSTAVNEIGINRVRLEIKSGAENRTDFYLMQRSGQLSYDDFKRLRYQIINDNSDAHNADPDGFKWFQIDDVIESVVIPMQRQMEVSGQHLWVNVCYVDFDESEFEHKANSEEYAEFVLETYRHIRDRYGFVPDSWEVVLEPDKANWSPVQVASAVSAAGRLLESNGFSPYFVAPSTASAARATEYIDAISKVPGALNYVGEFSYHRYHDATRETIETIAGLARYYGKETSMLEKIGADYRTLHADLKFGNNSSWQQYTLAVHGQPDNGAQYMLIGDPNNGEAAYSIGKRTYLLKHYFSSVRTGARRIDISSDNPSFDPIAFVNKDSSFVVLVLTSSDGSIEVKNLPPGTYKVSSVTEKDLDLDSTIATVTHDGHFLANSSGRGLVSIVSVGPVVIDGVS